MDRKNPIALIATSLLLVGCNSNKNTNHNFFNVVDYDFGIVKNVTPYDIKDTKDVGFEGVFEFHGRHYKDENLNAEFFNFSNSGFEVTFTGTTLEGYFFASNASSDEYRPYLGVCVDGDLKPENATPIQLTSKVNSNADGSKGGYSIHPHIVLAHDLPHGKHTVRVYKRSECPFSKVAIKSVSTDGEINQCEKQNFPLKMEFFGDSVTCGYGVEASDFYENFSTRTENSMKSFANYAANYLNADVSLVSVGGYPIYRSKYSLNNKPDNIPDMFSLASMDWNTIKPVTWDNLTYIPDVVVIALGGNDGSYLEDFKEGSGQYNLAVKHYKERYISFIDTILEAYPETHVVVSDEIIPLKDIYYQKMDEIVEEYNASHELKNNILRVKYDALKISKNRLTPCSGHPNEEMQHIAGKELALALKEVLKTEINDDNFTF